MLIIGITGTLGAGKGTIVEYLVNHHGFKHYSVRDYLNKQLKARGLEANRDNLVALANELREKHSPSYIAEELWNEASKNGTDCIIESIRTVGEVNALRAKGNFKLLAANADIETRYDRVVVRGSTTDKISFEEFKANEQREMSSTDPNKQNLAACIQLADYTIMNNGSIEDLNQQTEQVLHDIRN